VAYIDRADIEGRFGIENVRLWADVDNDQNPTNVAARIALSITVAQAEVDDRLRGGPIAVPLAEPPPIMIVNVCASLAAVWLYENRGSKDVDPDGRPVHKLKAVSTRAHAELRSIHTKRLVLDLPHSRSSPEVYKADG